MRLTMAVHRVSIDTVCRVSLTDRHTRFVVDCQCLEKLTNGNQSRHFVSSNCARLCESSLSAIRENPLFKLNLLDHFFVEKNLHAFSVFDIF